MSDVKPRNTRQKAAVRAALQKHGAFISAQQLHGLLQARGDSIGLSTVYRTLSSLQESGELDVITHGDGNSLYRICGDGHHHHLVCRVCRTTVEITAEPVEAWAKEIAAGQGYSDIQHTVELVGICANCSD